MLKKLNKGFLVTEAIIAIAIISIAIIASMSAAQKSVQLSDRSLKIAQANFLLEEGAEIVRILRDNNWNNISALDNNTDYYFSWNNGWSLNSDTPEIIDFFNRKVVFSEVYRDSISGSISSDGDLDSGTKLVSIFITWNQGGQTITKKLEFYLSDIFS